jgi:hypothetical protein
MDFGCNGQNVAVYSCDFLSSWGTEKVLQLETYLK